MLGKAHYWREQLTMSVWLIPGGFCAASFLLGLLMLWIDRRTADLDPGLVLLTMPVESARQVLSVIAGSVISVGGVTFSVTMVALTLTSGQYGPKILRHFLEDSGSKVSLGLFLGAYVYALVVLTGYAAADRPQLTVLVALVLAFCAVIGFIRFIHRTATDLQADEIVERIGQRLQEALGALAAVQAEGGRSRELLPWRRAARGHRPRHIGATQTGYVQTIDYPGLVAWCRDHDCRLEVRVRAGDFLVEGVLLFKAFGCAADALDDAVDELRGLVITGPVRTALQDPEYPITQLNQLVARALSPGINDPATAISCIDSFSLALAQVVDRDLPGCVLLDDDGAARVLCRFTDFDGICKAVFAPLRQFARSEVSVLVSVFEALCRLASLTARHDRLRILGLHGDLIWDDVEGLALADYDLADIRQRYRRLVRLVRREAVARA